MSTKTLSVQLQRDLIPQIDVEVVVGRLNAIASRPPSVQKGNASNELHLNVTFVTEDAPGLWDKIASELCLFMEPPSQISRGIIVVCEGDHGWNDYLLLYHFDRDKALDQFPPKQA